ncbi:MAG: hypothetical protein RJA76_646 [Bacteroidota bacterium]|jgi:hypothetical protein
MLKKCFLLFAFLFFCEGQLAYSQFWFLGQRGRERYVNMKFRSQASLAIGAGSSTYLGELLPSSALLNVGIKSTRMNIGVQYTKQFHPHFAYKAGLTYVQIAGDDNYYGLKVGDENSLFSANFERNLHFKNELAELSFLGVYEIVKANNFRKKRANFSPYITAGVAALYSNPKARGVAEVIKGDNGEILGYRQAGWVSLRGIQVAESGGIAGTEEYANSNGYSPMQIAIPFGFGFRLKMTNSIDFGFEFLYRKALTDYLDDVSDNRGSYLGTNATYSNRSINKDLSFGISFNPGYNEIYAANTFKLLPKPGDFLPNKPLVVSQGTDSYFTTQVMLIFHLGRPMGTIN